MHQEDSRIWQRRVMVFGMFSSLGTSPLVRLHNRDKAAMYKSLLEEHVPILQISGFENPLFMQDNV